MSQSDRFDVVVVGGGVAAGACVTTLRDEGFTGRIAVACAEPHAPYTRPGLTKQVLRGEKPEDAALWKPVAWYDEHDVALLTGSAATDLDVRAHRVRVAGRTLSYGSLVLATGAEPRSLDLGRGFEDRVHVIRSFSDAHRVRPLLGEGTRWLVIGGGFIGSEFAASARLTGSEVHLVAQEALILQGPFGEVAAGWFDSRLRARGVDVHAQTTVSSVERDGDALRVVLASGASLTVDHVCVGVGVAPSTGLAQQAGIELDERGIATDRSLRTSAPDVYAAGDACAYDSVLHGRRVRIEHWDVARSHGVHVARQIASGEHRDFDQLPYFFGTMGDWAFLEYVGIDDGRAVVRGSLEGDDLAIAYLADDDSLVAVLTVDRPSDLEAARELVPQRRQMQPELLVDPARALEACAR